MNIKLVLFFLFQIIFLSIWIFRWLKMEKRKPLKILWIAALVLFFLPLDAIPLICLLPDVCYGSQRVAVGFLALPFFVISSPILVLGTVLKIAKEVSLLLEKKSV